MAGHFLTMPDQRAFGEKVGDAIDALPQGLDDAAEQLENRTPGEKWMMPLRMRLTKNDVFAVFNFSPTRHFVSGT